jgi:hypothetical protein
LLKAELEEEMVTVLVSCGGGRKKKKQKKKICSGEREEGWFFGLLWTPFSPPPGHKTRLYLKEVEEGNLFYTGVKFHPLILLGEIPTVSSK